MLHRKLKILHQSQELFCYFPARYPNFLKVFDFGFQVLELRFYVKSGCLFLNEQADERRSTINFNYIANL